MKILSTLPTACSHPEGIKPICKCGENRVCPICGYGYGAFPCSCGRFDSVVQKYKDRFSGAWEKMALGK